MEPIIKMRIGKLQERVLKVMYEYETSPKTKEDFGHYIRWGNRLIKVLTAKQIVERITGLKYPKEKDYGIDRIWRDDAIVKATALLKAGKKIEEIKTDPRVTEMNKKIKDWHTSSTSTYRAIKLLEKNILITDIRIGFKSYTCRNYWKLTSKGRRIISHRIPTQKSGGAMASNPSKKSSRRLAANSLKAKKSRLKKKRKVTPKRKITKLESDGIGKAVKCLQEMGFPVQYKK